MAPSFAGQKIWLVGASEGIGEAVARLLAASGAQLCLSARSGDKLVQLAAALPGAGHLVQTLDVTDAASVRTAWDAIHARWGGLDAVIYNAGAYTPLGAKAFNLAMAESMLDVNFRGALRVLDCVIPDFVARKGGHIVLVASVAGYRGLPRAIGYGASKAALLHLAENLAIDLSDCGVKVQAVCPGFVKTRLTDKNAFPMPFIISPELAAQRIVEGMGSPRFEIHFPKRFSLILKTLQLLPHWLYFKIANRL
jgi:short-subunit dehydrogenase